MAAQLTPFVGALWWGGLAVLGMVVGVIAGMFGVGGGFLLIPALNILFRIPIDVAVGTGLCITPGTGVAALRRHSRLKQGETKIDWIMIGGALVGASAGAQTVTYLSSLGNIDIVGRSISAAKFWISAAYVVVLCLVALYMIRSSGREHDQEPSGPGPLARLKIPPYTFLPAIRHMASIPGLAYVGLMMGFLSGLMGLGGGVILMPILIYGVGMPLRMAAGTGIILLIASSLTGTLAHALFGHVHLGVAMVLLSGSTIGAPIGATITSRTDPSSLHRLFGVLVILTAAMVVWSLFSSMR